MRQTGRASGTSVAASPSSATRTVSNAADWKVAVACRRSPRRALTTTVRGLSAALVQRSGQVAVGLPRGIEIGSGLLQRGRQFNVVLLQPRDLPLELVDVGRG